MKNMFGSKNQCDTVGVNWFDWILVIVIIAMALLWYRERRENKKANDLNTELDSLK